MASKGEWFLIYRLDTASPSTALAFSEGTSYDDAITNYRNKTGSRALVLLTIGWPYHRTKQLPSYSKG